MLGAAVVVVAGGFGFEGVVPPFPPSQTFTVDEPLELWHILAFIYLLRQEILLSRGSKNCRLSEKLTSNLWQISAFIHGTEKCYKEEENIKNTFGCDDLVIM